MALTLPIVSPSTPKQQPLETLNQPMADSLSRQLANSGTISIRTVAYEKKLNPPSPHAMAPIAVALPHHSF